MLSVTTRLSLQRKICDHFGISSSRSEDSKKCLRKGRKLERRRLGKRRMGRRVCGRKQNRSKRTEEMGFVQDTAKKGFVACFEVFNPFVPSFVLQLVQGETSR